jgi:antitoxin component YwqK of YwqJK toxin-antitoxin module
MIRILATALLVLGLTASGAFATSMSDLVETNGIYYKKFTNEPFTGRLNEGRSQGTIKSGKMVGHWIFYHENGRVLAKGAMKNGGQEGHWVFHHENGWVLAEGPMKNGKAEGPWVKYYEDGTKNEDLSGTYRNDVKVSD